MTSDLSGHQHPTAKALFQTKVERSVRRHQSELARIVKGAETKRRPIVTPAGLYIGEAVEVPLPDGRMSSILFRMTQGLYYDSRSKPLSDTIPYDVRQHPLQEWKTLASQFDGKPAKVLGDVFECAFMWTDEDPSLTLWLLRFYQRVVFTVQTGSNEEEEPNT